MTGLSAQSRPRVLVSAYACDPETGSEPGTGWAWARAAAAFSDVWLLTRPNYAERIEAAIALEQLPITPVYSPSRLLGTRRLISVDYVEWQLRAVPLLRRLHRQHDFDVAHHVTFAASWQYCALADVPGLPFVLGPVGGPTRRVPEATSSLPAWDRSFREPVRTAALAVLGRTVGLRSARRAALVAALNTDVAEHLGRHGVASEVQPHVALARTLVVRLREERRDRGARQRTAVFIGRLVGWKGILLAVQAIADPALSDWRLEVYGEGRLALTATELAQRLGVQDRVVMHGHRPRDEVLESLATASVLLFPSLHDSNGWAVAEAASLGVPVVCLRAGGPPDLVRGSSSVAVVDGPELVARLAAAVAQAGQGGEDADQDPPTDAWLEDRLPALLEDWYRRASA